jgi:uncharacterized protein (DUF2126 family)
VDGDLYDDAVAASIEANAWIAGHLRSGLDGQPPVNDAFRLLIDHGAACPTALAVATAICDRLLCEIAEVMGLPAPMVVDAYMRAVGDLLADGITRRPGDG